MNVATPTGLAPSIQAVVVTVLAACLCAPAQPGDVAAMMAPALAQAPLPQALADSTDRSNLGPRRAIGTMSPDASPRGTATA